MRGYLCYVFSSGVLLLSILQEKTKLPNCRYNSNFSNIVQLSEVEPKCLWDRGQCQQVFDNVWEFYSHVRNHIKTGAVENKCQWQGTGWGGGGGGGGGGGNRGSLYRRVL